MKNILQVFAYLSSPYIFTDCDDVNTAVVILKVFDENMKELSYPDPDDPFSITLNADEAMTDSDEELKDMDVEGDGFITTASFNERCAV